MPHKNEPAVDEPFAGELIEPLAHAGVEPGTAIILAPKKRGGKPFVKGDPRIHKGGKPKGARHKVTILCEQLVQGDAEDIVKAVVAAAKRGNPAGIQAVMSILCPPRKGRAVEIDMGPLDGSAESIATATTAILKAAAEGLISAEEGQQYGILLAAAGRAYETEAMEQRIVELESQVRALR